MYLKTIIKINFVLISFNYKESLNEKTAYILCPSNFQSIFQVNTIYTRMHISTTTEHCTLRRIILFYAKYLNHVHKNDTHVLRTFHD